MYERLDANFAYEVSQTLFCDAVSDEWNASEHTQSILPKIETLFNSSMSN